MKRMPSSLIDFLNATPTCYRADLFVIQLPNGQTLYATSGQMDISVPVGTPGTAARYTVSGKCVPWRDAAYSFPGQGTGLDPVAVPVTPGVPVTVTYESGSWTQGGSTGSWDANGENTYFVSPGDAAYASGRCLVATRGAQLLGAFADGSGALLAAPFPLGNSATVTPPTGAVHLLMGMNDGTNWSDNSGAVVVRVGIGGAASLIAGVTFLANQYGKWERGRIVSEASSKLSANSMDLTLIPQPTTQYPGLNLGILNAALNHLFDGADIRVYTAYMPVGSYGDVSAGIETKFRGFITRPTEISRNKAVFECYDPFALLNLKVPARLFQATCPWSFCDANCTLVASDYTVGFTAASGSDQKSLTPSSRVHASGRVFLTRRRYLFDGWECRA
jgi:hypothetical protein